MHGPLDRYPSACNDVAHLRAAGRGKVYRILRPRARLLNRRRQGGRSTKLRNCYSSHCSSAAADERVQEFDGGCPRASDDVLGQPTGFGMWSWGYASKGIGAIPCESRRLGLSSRRTPSPRLQVHIQGASGLVPLVGRHKAKGGITPVGYVDRLALCLVPRWSEGTSLRWRQHPKGGPEGARRNE